MLFLSLPYSQHHKPSPAAHPYHRNLSSIKPSAKKTPQAPKNTLPTELTSPPLFHSPLRAPTPHILHQPIPLRQPIQTIVPFAHRPHKPAQSVHLVLPRVAPVLVHFADGDLHRGMVFRFDDAVRRGAFAGDVAGGFWVCVSKARGGGILLTGWEEKGERTGQQVRLCRFP